MSKRKTPSQKHVAQTRWETAGRPTMSVAAPAGAAIIILIAFFAYFPSLSGGFILDDDVLLTENGLIMSSDGVYKFWFTAKADDYWPLSSTTLWIEWRLWGNYPTGYHVTNLLLHIAESLLIWMILRKLSVPGAFFGAIIFAVHPVNVESVAWIAQRKNMMAMLFFLLSIFWYLKFLARAPRLTDGWCPVAAKQILSTAHRPLTTDHTPPPTSSSFILHPSSFYLWYWLSLAAFTLAMLSKGSTAMLPILFMGIAWWLGRLTFRESLRIGPFFLIAGLFTWVNMWFQTHGINVVVRDVDFTQRLTGAGGVVWFYLYKALVPLGLAFVYPQWNIQAGKLLWWLPLLAVIAITAALFLASLVEPRLRGLSWTRPVLFAWVFFCASLVPVLGFTDVGFMKYSLVADHYQHIAIIGVVVLVAAAWGAWHARLQGKMRQAGMVVAIGAVCLLAFLTWRQSELYNNAIDLYQDTLRKNPGCWMAHNNLGLAMHNKGRAQEAIEHYEQTLLLNPDYPEALNNLGNTYLDLLNRPQDAIPYYKKALSLRPYYIKAFYNLGNAYKALGQYDLAMEHYRQVVKWNPIFPEAHNNMGVILVKTGRPGEAIEHFQEVVRYKPNDVVSYSNLALAYSLTHQSQKAIAAAQKALQLARAQNRMDQARRLENWLKSGREKNNAELE
jgi:protein O-mannosyl-transferase